MEKWRRALPRGRVVGALALALVSGIALATAGRWWKQGAQLARSHAAHEVAHPGWSFPSRVVSEPVPLTVPAGRLIAEARARGYAERCPTPGPGELCERTGKVVPRSGGELEPVLLGWLIGPDGELRAHLPLAEAPKHLLDAIVAAEDRDFRKHRGVAVGAVLRATFANARERAWAQGGSTLSMQVARAFGGEREKRFARKVREAVLAMAVDRELGKDGVLQAYLDAPYLGQRGGLSICGFEAAAEHYFGKPAKALSLAEAATLAGLLPAPAKFAPDRFPELAKERRNRVLKAMAETFGYDVKEALDEPVATVPARPLAERYPAYLSVARAWLESRWPAATVYGAGLVATAAIDLAAQEETERVLGQRTQKLEGVLGKRPQPLQSAAALLDVQTGRIRAVWGGFGETATSFNRVTQARRQPGSAFKPLVYALALSQGSGADGKPRFSAASTEPNALRVFKTPRGDWRPRNVTGEYTPTVSLAYGLALSQNVATASLLQDLGGPRPLIEFAQRLGFDTRRFPPELGLALGQGEVTVLEMAQFAGLVANGGRSVQGAPVVRLVDAAGVEMLREPESVAVLSPEVAALTREMMRLVVDFGTGGAVRGAADESGYAGQVMGKTGTTDRDVWFVGATPRWAAAVWLGYDQPEPLGASASDLAAPMWGWWMGRVTRGEGPLPSFPEMPKISHRWICALTGKLAGPACQKIYAPFVPGSEPRATCQEEHPAPSEAEEGKVKYEGLWQRIAREKAEREAVPAGESAAPAEPAP